NFDDAQADASPNASRGVVPPAWPEGEGVHADGKALLTAAVAGYETVTRLGAAAPGQFHHHGYHATPICGAFAAGIVAGKLMGLRQEALASTLGIFRSQAPGLQAVSVEGHWTT